MLTFPETDEMPEDLPESNWGFLVKEFAQLFALGNLFPQIFTWGGRTRIQGVFTANSPNFFLPKTWGNPPRSHF